MQIDVSTGLALIGIVFAAGGAWKTLQSAAAQGRRIGKLEQKVAKIEGRLTAGGRRLTLPGGNPIPEPDDDAA